MSKKQLRSAKKTTKAAFFANDVTGELRQTSFGHKKNCRRQTCRQQFFMFLIKVCAAYITCPCHLPPAGIAGVSFLNACNNGFGCQQCLATLVAFCRALLVTSFAGSSDLPCPDDNAAFQACVCCDIDTESFQSLQYNLRTGLLIAFQCILPELLHPLQRGYMQNRRLR